MDLKKTDQLPRLIKTYLIDKEGMPSNSCPQQSCFIDCNPNQKKVHQIVEEQEEGMSASTIEEQNKTNSPKTDSEARPHPNK